jgi:thiol-disulfide isomerase/thioredoxin
LPEISLTALEANNINIDDSRKKITILDFWASWCKPCVEKFPEMKKRASDFEDEIEVIAINVDYASRTDKAREVIEAYQLDWPHVISGKGNYDPLWKKKKPVCY